MLQGSSLCNNRVSNKTRIIPSGCFVLAAKWLMIFPIKAGHQLLINHAVLGGIVRKTIMIDCNNIPWISVANAKVETLEPVHKSQILGRVVPLFRQEVTGL